MIKRFLQKYIKRNKDQNFSFDSNIRSIMILELIISKVVCYLRGKLVIRYFKKPNNLYLGKGVCFNFIQKISWGHNVFIGNNSKISGLGLHGVEIGNRVSIGDYCRLIVSTSFNNIGQSIIIGNDVGIGEFSYLGGAGGLVIGADTIIGQYFSTHPENHNFSDSSLKIRHQGVTRKGILIGENCWIGSKVTILDGVSIGDTCVIGAGSVVTKSFANGSIIAGVPAKKIGNI